MLYVMRHGKTEWNELRKLQGRTDIPLAEAGIAMAKEAALLYKDVHFDVCFSSPLLRAKETAELVLKGRNIPIIFDDRLMEMSFGEYEGIVGYMDMEELPVNVLFTDPSLYKAAPKGESLEALFERTGQFLKEMVYPLLEDGKDVLIIAHGVTNSSIITAVRGLDYSHLWDEKIENCKLKLVK